MSKKTAAEDAAPTNVETRPCPRCRTAVAGVPDEEGGVRVIRWTCTCGWRRMIAESGAVRRPKV